MHPCLRVTLLVKTNPSKLTKYTALERVLCVKDKNEEHVICFKDKNKEKNNIGYIALIISVSMAKIKII